MGNVRDRVTPFSDIDPLAGDAWFSGYVMRAAKEGLITGIQKNGKTIFGGKEPAAVADVVTVFGRFLGIDPEAKALSSLATKMPGYALQAAATVDVALDAQGRTLDDIFKADPDASANRGQIAMLLATLFTTQLPAADTTVLSRYDDIGTLPRYLRNDISRVIAANIMVGSSGKFSPEQPFNRAQFATVIGRLSERMQVEDTSPDPQDEIIFHSAAAEASSSSEGPQFDIHAVNEDMLHTLQTLVDQYEVGKKIDRESGVISDVRRGIDAVQNEFDMHNRIYVVHIPMVVNMENQLLEVPYQELVKILRNQGYSVK